MATKVNYFAIKENDAGNFHFDHFGSKVGGDRRDVPVVFIVLDAEGKLIAKSTKAYTAKDLNIADKGRQDYDNNKYHNSHFFVRKDNRVVPNSALARYIEWD